MSRRHHLYREQHIPRSVEEIFEFFSAVENLEAITPDYLRFRVITPTPLELRAGALIDYRLQLFRVPFTWRTRIESWDPPHRFVDTQLRGPYSYFHHTHRFEAVDGGTRMTDSLYYELPLGPLGSLAHALFVRRSLDDIFDYRGRRIAERYPPV